MLGLIYYFLKKLLILTNKEKKEIEYHEKMHVCSIDFSHDVIYGGL